MIDNFLGAYKKHTNIAPMRFAQDISISNTDISNAEMTLPSIIDTAYLLISNSTWVSLNVLKYWEKYKW